MKLTSHVDAIERAVRALGAFPLPRERIGVSQMNTLIRSCFVLPVLVVAFISETQTTVAQQVQYYVHELEDLPEQNSANFTVYGINDNRVASGMWSSPNGSRGFFYELVADSGSPGGFAGQYNDLATLLNLPGDWVGTRCYKVNNFGIGIGRADLPGGGTKAFWFDLNAPLPTWQFLPEPDVVGGSPSFSPSHINNLGDIVVSFVNGAGTREGYVYNPFLANPPEYLLDNAGEPIEIQGFVKIGDSGEVIGNFKDYSGLSRHIFVWKSGQPVQLLGGPSHHYVYDSNSLGEFTGESQVATNLVYDAFVFHPTTQQFELLPSITDSGRAINDSGDIVGHLGSQSDAFLYRDGNLLLLDDLVIGEHSQFFRNATEILLSYANTGLLTNRNATGYGLFSCRAEIVSTTGSGKNKTTVVDQRRFILIPVIAAPPTSHTYSSADTPKAIPDPGKITSSIAVTDNFVIADLNVTLNINHQRAQDMDVFLISPNGTRVELFTDVGGNGLNFVGTTLDSQATASITSGSAPFTGTYRPEGSLSAFNGLSTLGTWQLEVTDDKATKTGTLQNWSFTVQVN